MFLKMNGCRSKRFFLSSPSQSLLQSSSQPYFYTRTLKQLSTTSYSLVLSISLSRSLLACVYKDYILLSHSAHCEGLSGGVRPHLLHPRPWRTPRCRWQSGISSSRLCGFGALCGAERERRRRVCFSRGSGECWTTSPTGGTGRENENAVGKPKSYCWMKMKNAHN